MARILRTPQSDADLTEIWSYIANENRIAANNLVRKFDDMLERLAENPDLGAQQSHIRQNLRCKVVARRYLIFYEPFDDGIHVIRILHGARNWENMV